jgi:hypothetical protein
MSARGCIQTISQDPLITGVKRISIPVRRFDSFPVTKYSFLGHGYSPSDSDLGPKISIPYSLPLVFAAALAAFPWLPWRFSLRTLLIGMTALAVVLGAAVWASK